MYFFRQMGLILTVIVVWAISLLAQDKKENKLKPGWNNDMVGSLNLTQTSFDNWTQGGENSLSWQLNFNSKFIYDQPKFNWSNRGKISYGQIKVGNQDVRKSVDEIKLESVYTRKVGLFVEPYISATAETQFSKGYQYTDTSKTAISNFLDPGYFTQSVGLGYSKNEIIQSRVGAALKETVTNDFPAYADDPETENKIEKTKVEVGMESVTDLSYALAENLLLTSNLQLFSNLVAFNQVDVRWDTILSAKVAKYVDVNFNVKIFYDRDISKKRQLKQALSLGLTYTFI